MRCSGTARIVLEVQIDSEFNERYTEGKDELVDVTDTFLKAELPEELYEMVTDISIRSYKEEK